MRPSGTFPLCHNICSLPATLSLQSLRTTITQGFRQKYPLLSSLAIMATVNWRTINVDLLDPESPANFDISSLLPSIPSVSASEVQTLSSQIKQLLRGGDSEGALRGALENAPYGGDAQAKVSKPPATEAARCSGRGRNSRTWSRPNDWSR